MTSIIELPTATTYDSLLHEELLAAGIDPEYCGVQSNTETVFVILQRPEDVPTANAVIADHDHTQPSAVDRINAERQGALAEVLDRYSGFENDTFLEIVGKIDQWAINVNAALDGATTLAQIRPIVQGAFSDLATFIGPLLAKQYIEWRRGE